MLSISAMSSGQGRYYTQLAQEDYYLSGGEPPGQWMGKGAERMGLLGEVDKDRFSQLFEGFSPDGRPLVQNAGAEDRKPGWDLTFSAPKSVSVLWSQLSGEMGAEIRASHAEAVATAMSYLEEVTGYTRRGKGGFIHEKADLLAAAFEHGTSRAQDPQLHTHVLILNLGVRADGTTGSLTSPEFYQHKMAAGAVYRAELAHQLWKRLGLDSYRVKNWFELAKVSPDLIKEFSKRRTEIESRLKDLEIASAKASEIAALDTRSRKEQMPRSQLFADWRAIGIEKGFGPEEAAKLIGEPVREVLDPRAVVCAMTLSEALSKLTAQQSYFAERDLIRCVAEEGTGLGVSSRDLIEAAKEYLHSKSIQLGRDRGYDQFTTPEMYALEQDMLERVERLSKKSGLHGTGELTTEVRAAHVEAAAFGSVLNDEQKKAVYHITTTEGMMKVVSGMAGTGKTTMLKIAKEVWEVEGQKVIGASLSGKAAIGLQEGSGIESSTISRLLFKWDGNPKLVDLSAPDVLVIDEAGMVGTRQMSRILKYAEQKNIKLVLVGDSKQLQPIEAGGPFAAIAKMLGGANLTEIIRQKEQWSRDAVHAVAGGHAVDALKSYAEKGFLTVTDSRKEARTELLSAWKENGLKSPKDHLIIAGTNEDTTILNRDIQAMRKHTNQLGSVYIRNDSDRFFAGDRILFTKNSKLLGVQNGLLGTITHVVPGAAGFGSLRVKLDTGRSAFINFSEYDSVKLGYAVTTHKAQGVTAQNAYVLTDPEMQDLHLSYVQVSRARDATRIFASRDQFDASGVDLEELANVMQRDRSKKLAMELLAGERELERRNPDLEISR